MGWRLSWRDGGDVCYGGVTCLEDGLGLFAACWDDLADPRSGNAGLHDLDELLMIALCAVLCGGQGVVDIGVRPWRWTDSGRCFDRLPGVMILELRGADIAQCRM